MVARLAQCGGTSPSLGRSVPAPCADLVSRDHRVGFLAVRAVRSDDADALAGKLQRRRTANTAILAGDECDATSGIGAKLSASDFLPPRLTIPGIAARPFRAAPPRSGSPRC